MTPVTPETVIAWTIVAFYVMALARFRSGATCSIFSFPDWFMALLAGAAIAAIIADKQ